jgi:hypothetical protein
MRATLALIRHISEELLANGTYKNFTNNSIPYHEVNELFL